MPKKLNKSDRGICISVHPSFYDNIFEEERKNLQKKLGLNLSQRSFTEFLAKSNAKISYPKADNLFAPKKRRGRFVI